MCLFCRMIDDDDESCRDTVVAAVDLCVNGGIRTDGLYWITLGSGLVPKQGVVHGMRNCGSAGMRQNEG